MKSRSLRRLTGLRQLLHALTAHNFSNAPYRANIFLVCCLELLWAFGIQCLTPKAWGQDHTYSLLLLSVFHGITGAFLLAHLYRCDRDRIRLYFFTLATGKLFLLSLFSANFPVAYMAALVTPFLFRPFLIRPHKTRVLGGIPLKHPSDVQHYYNQNRHKHDPGVPNVQVDIPTPEACKHFLTVGATGSGKSILQGKIIRRIVPEVWQGSDKRALFFDPSHDLVSRLATLWLACEVIILNPFDRRHAAIDLAKDIDSLAAASALADILVPSETNSNAPFFRDAVATLLEGILMFFNYTCPGRWRFRDVIWAMLSLERAQHLLASDPRTAHYGELGDEKTIANVRATVGVKLRPYMPIAAAWEQAQYSISLTEWVQDSSILILGEDETSRGPLRALNRFILTRLSQLLLSDPKTYDDVRTWVLLDEFPTLGNFQLSPDDNPLKELFTKGRKRGVSLHVVVQDITDLWKIHGKELTETLISQCLHKAILRLEGVETAKWAENLFGKLDILRTTTNRPVNRFWRVFRFPGFVKESESEQITSVPVVSASAFKQLKTPSKKRRQGLEAYCISTFPYKASLSSQQISESYLHADPSVPGVDPIPPEWLHLKPWTQEDYKRLNIAHLIEGDDAIKARDASPSPFSPPDSILPDLDRLKAELEQHQQTDDTTET